MPSENLLHHLQSGRLSGTVYSVHPALFPPNVTTNIGGYSFIRNRGMYQVACNSPESRLVWRPNYTRMEEDLFDRCSGCHLEGNLRLSSEFTTNSNSLSCFFNSGSIGLFHSLKKSEIPPFFKLKIRRVFATLKEI